MSPNSDIVKEAEPLMTSRPSFLHRARDLGFSMFPVPPPRPGVPPNTPGDGKTPTVKWKPLQTERASDRQLDEWFGGEPMNLAIVTGAISDVVVVDCDSPDAVRWWTRGRPYTPWQTQTSKGFHLWYRHPGAHVRNKARIKTDDGELAIDVRGDGGYVIAPGSRHASGAEYLEAGNWNAPIERVPVFWPGWLARPERPKPPAATRARPTGDLVERARRYLAAVPKPEIGCGSDVATLSAACRLVRGFGLPTAEAEQLLWEWAGDRAGWTRAWIAQKVAHAERYGTEPLGALR